MEILVDRLQRFNIKGVSLIGQFNNKDEYVLPFKIKKQFISVPKIITHIEKNIIYCYFKSVTTTYNFIVEIDDNKKDDIVCAKLFLVEFFKDANGVKRSIVSFLTKYTGYEANNFLDRVKVVLKLFDKNEGEGKNFNEEIIADQCKLQKRKIYYAFVNDMANNDKKMVQESIDILKGCGDIGKFILENISMYLKNNNVEDGTLKYWILASDKLIELLKKHKDKLNYEATKKLEMVYQNYLLLNKKTISRFKIAEEYRFKSFDEVPFFVPDQKINKNKSLNEENKKNLDNERIKNLDQNNNGELDYKEYLNDEVNEENNDEFFLSNILESLLCGSLLFEFLQKTIQDVVDFGKELIDLPE